MKRRQARPHRETGGGRPGAVVFRTAAAVEPESSPSPARPASNEQGSHESASASALAPAMTTLRGLAVSPGIAIGPVLVYDERGVQLPARGLEGDEATVSEELGRLDEALESARVHAEAAEADARNRLGAKFGDILGSHVRMITDPGLRGEARRKIEQERIPAEHAVSEVLEGFAARLERLADAYLAGRASDVRDVEHRILDELAGGPSSDALADPAQPSLAIAHDLSPSQAAALDPAKILGFATEAGGRTSHTAIVAAALEIPAVVGLGAILDRSRVCRGAIIDGDEGLVIFDPDRATLQRYRRLSAERAARFENLLTLASLPAETRDGTPLALLGNIEFPAEVAACRDRGAQGIGLYRTEFLYLGADRPPTEEEQFAAYSSVVKSLAGKPVVIRTLDLGADKLPSYQVSGAAPRNPFLGLRSIRISLRDLPLFRTQLRAILRASTLGDVRVMFPLIANLAEFRQARAVLDEVASELIGEGVPVSSNLAVGAMIEVPAAVIMADRLAMEADFFSLGTNDLIQYALAADRTDETVADLYSPADPAILRLISQSVAAARAHRIDVSVCGSMGGEPLYTMLLAGLGIRSFSMPPHQLPEIRRVVRSIHLDQARALAEEALRQDDAANVVGLLREAINAAVPDAMPNTA